MKKKLFIFLSALTLTGLLASCGPTPGSETSGTSSSSSISTSEEESYVIRVTAPTGVTYHLSHDRASAGEQVTLTITSIPSGYTIQTVTMNGTTLSESSSNVYTFSMPNRSVTITISCSVEGDVTLVGDVVAVLEKEGDIYVARDVKVEKAGNNYFSYKVQTGGSSQSILPSTDLDENRCFADVGSTYGSSYELVIEGGNTYDFYYDPTSLHPCYVVRTEVNKLPNSVESLYNLFDGSMRSESTVNYPGLNRIQYSTTNKENLQDLKILSYDMKIYEGNASYAKVEDTLDSKTYHVYKNIDEDNGVLEIVDTYTVKKGNNDRNRYSYNNSGAYSGRWDIVDSSIEDISRTEVREEDALVNINHGAHYGYYLEREFMDAYRVGFTDDEVSSYSIDISSDLSTTSDDFKTKINSYVEYNSTAGTYTQEKHEAYIYEAELDFDKAGRLLGLSYSKTKYGSDAWNFSSHTPLVGQDGTKVKTLEVTYSYGSLYDESTLTFDTTPYFISSIDTLRFYNSKTSMPANDENSYLHYSDKVSLNDLYNTSYTYLNKFEYTPSTSLDVWQYGPVTSSNESVVRHESTDLWYYMSCVGVGNSTVTFSNHTKNTGTTKDVVINVNATQKFHSISIYSTWGGTPGDVTSSTSANITAGTTQSFKISVTPNSAPVIYTAVSENPDLLRIVEVGEKLTLDATGAASITTPTTVRVRIDSDWFSSDTTNKYAMFSFTIIPMALNPIGSTWGMEELEEHVKIDFTDEEYSSSTVDNPIYKGIITDDGYVDETTTLGSFRAEFIYTYKNGQVKAQVTSIYFENNSDGWSTDPRDYSIEFYYEASTDRYGLFLAEAYYDSEYEGFIFSPLFGECDEDGLATSYSPFVRLGD